MSDQGQPWTVRRLLEWTSGFFGRKGVDSPRLSAELLLAHVLSVPRIKLYTDYERAVGEKELADFRALVQRAGEGEPIAYLTGKAHFFNLELEVNADVLIPRPDTETLVENVIQLARLDTGLQAARILDLCTGSGCIAAALAQHLKHAMVLAVDLSAGAVAVARRNIQRLGLTDRVQISQGDLYDGLAGTQPFNLLTANPPYIPSEKWAQLDRGVRDYEPRSALDGGPDGLEVSRRILAGAGPKLVGGGSIFLEIAFDQGPAAMELIGQYPQFVKARILKDYGGKDRVLTAKKS